VLRKVSQLAFTTSRERLTRRSTDWRAERLANGQTGRERLQIEPPPKRTAERYGKCPIAAAVLRMRRRSGEGPFLTSSGRNTSQEVGHPSPPLAPPRTGPKRHSSPQRYRECLAQDSDFDQSIVCRISLVVCFSLNGAHFSPSLLSFFALLSSLC
jgi:hypothetical protein